MTQGMQGSVPSASGGSEGHPITDVREAHDAGSHSALRRHPGDEDAKLDVALDETFPTSDPPSNTQPGKGKDPAPSSGYDPALERAQGIG